MRLVSLTAIYYVKTKYRSLPKKNFQYGYAGFWTGKDSFVITVDRYDFIKLYRKFMKKKKPNFSVNGLNNSIREIRYDNHPIRKK